MNLVHHMLLNGAKLNLIYVDHANKRPQIEEKLSKY